MKVLNWLIAIGFVVLAGWVFEGARALFVIHRHGPALVTALYGLGILYLAWDVVRPPRRVVGDRYR